MQRSGTSAGRIVIADLNSQNGVWIGERQIKTEEPLPENVWVTIGPHRLMLMPDEKAPYTLMILTARR